MSRGYDVERIVPWDTAPRSHTFSYLVCSSRGEFACLSLGWFVLLGHLDIITVL